MHVKEPNGNEFLTTGTFEELTSERERLLKENPARTINIYKEGESFKLNDETVVEVTPQGLKVLPKDLKGRGLTRNQRKRHRKKCRG